MARCHQCGKFTGKLLAAQFSALVTAAQFRFCFTQPGGLPAGRRPIGQQADERKGDGGDHNDPEPPDAAAYWAAVNEFIQEVRMGIPRSEK